MLSRASSKATSRSALAEGTITVFQHRLHAREQRAVAPSGSFSAIPQLGGHLGKCSRGSPFSCSDELLIGEELRFVLHHTRLDSRLLQNVHQPPRPTSRVCHCVGLFFSEGGVVTFFAATQRSAPDTKTTSHGHDSRRLITHCTTSLCRHT